MATAPTDVAKGDWLDSTCIRDRETQLPPSQSLRMGNLRTARTRIGLSSDVPIDQHHEGLEHQRLAWSKARLVLREPLAEFFWTFTMVLFGDGSVAQVLLSAGQQSSPGRAGSGNYQSISWG